MPNALLWSRPTECWLAFVHLEHSFTLPVALDDAWDLLVHVDRLAAFVPGASVSEVHGDEFAGTMRLDVGALGGTYQGEAAFCEKDETAHRVVIEAAGRDLRGAGTASATVTATLEPAGAHATRVRVLTDLSLSGADIASGVAQPPAVYPVRPPREPRKLPLWLPYAVVGAACLLVVAGRRWVHRYTK